MRNVWSDEKNSFILYQSIKYMFIQSRHFLNNYENAQFELTIKKNNTKKPLLV